ncbi:MAG: hypothetical protein JWO98_5396 [Frankiales bacterium]|nr:hypothetical protein [Frankiales bacterium]
MEIGPREPAGAGGAQQHPGLGISHVEPQPHRPVADHRIGPAPCRRGMSGLSQLKEIVGDAPESVTAVSVWA